MSTIRLTEAVQKDFVQFQKKHKLHTANDALQTMLKYFAEVGDDPVNPKFTAKAQLAEISERVNQVVKFIRVYEKAELRPIMQDIAKINKQMIQILPEGKIVSDAEFQNLVKTLNELIKNL